jgi:FkbM family methyltransferase
MDGLKESVRGALRAITMIPPAARVLANAGRAGLVPSAVWKRLPVDRIIEVSVPGGSSFQYISTPNDSIGRSLFWRGLEGSWEAETIRAFQVLAGRARSFIDIGANTGVYTLLACTCNPQLQAISFEPVPRVYDRLRRNIELNGWLSRCDLRMDAVSDHVGTAQMLVPTGDVPASASLDLGFHGLQGETIDVAVTTVDVLCNGREHVDLVKIDVEGHEAEVLVGMEDVLSRYAPTIIIECLDDGPYREIESILSRFDYRFYHLTSPQPVKVEKIVPDQSKIFRNFLCTVHQGWDVFA